MPNNYPSLFHYLTTKNPALDISNCDMNGTNTRSGAIPWDLPRRIQDWADFEYQSLESIYNGALWNVLRCELSLRQQVHIDGNSRKIHREGNMRSIVTLWNKTIVSSALKAAQKKLGSELPHEKIDMSEGDQAQAPEKVPKIRVPEGKRQKKREPDWAGMKLSTIKPHMRKRKAKESDKAKNLLPGDTKISPKWKSAQLATIRDVNKAEMIRKNWFQPIGQIYTYCVRSNARYGYIITDDELVVFRIRPSPQADAPRGQDKTNKKQKDQEEIREMDPNIDVGPDGLEDFVTDAPEATRALTDGIMEYKAIPWHSHVRAAQRRPEVMTVNVGLWWLHMMAAESSKIEEEYTALRDAVWDTDLGNKTEAYDTSDSDSDSQGTLPLAETPFNSQSITRSSGSDLGQKRARDDDDDAVTSPPKRLTRGRK